MKKISILFSFLFLSFAISCSPDDSDGAEQGINFNVPSNYTFERTIDNETKSTVSFTGQTERLQMGAILNQAFLDDTKTEQDLLDLFYNNKPNPFNTSSEKSIAEKTAENRTAHPRVIDTLNVFIRRQVVEVFPLNTSVTATEGNAGSLRDGDTDRYVNARGLEYNQAFGKALIGALTLDQIVNDYLTEAVLDKGANRSDNDAGLLVEGKNYTQMEHYWDEGFGYLYGLEADAANPTTGVDDFLSKYLKRVNDDDDYKGISNAVYKAFVIGRAAIVAKNYTERDKQADIIQKKLSEIIAIRCIYYLQQGKLGIASRSNLGPAFHNLSEGYGFIYSLQFTRNPNTNLPYFSSEQVDGMLDDIYGKYPGGFWDVTDTDLDAVSNKIAEAFNLSLAQAGS